jgi:hypothetical protein
VVVPRRTLLLAAAALALAGVAAVVAFALGSGADQLERPSADPGGPYVVSAIDYHFHDAHPTFPIGPDRDLVVKNVGRNLHNVTIPALGYSHDVRPGQELTIADVAERLGAPGRYAFFCRFHRDRGMRGSIIIGNA